MDRRRALEIFGLREDATKEIIIKRYNVLFKKTRYSDTKDAGYTREELDEAYKLLMGIEYRDPEAERKKLERQKHPNPVFKALGIDQDKLSNFIYYYKWYFIGGALVLALVISVIVSLVNRVDPDFKLIVAGEIQVMDIDAVEKATGALIGAQEPQAQYIPISDKIDSPSLTAFEQKLSVELMAGSNDIFILDMNLYKRLAPFGAFVPLDDRLEELGITSYDEELVVAVENDDGESYPPRLYGVDVTGSRILEEQGVMGERMIAVMMINGENTENALVYIRMLVESVQ